MRAKFSLRTAVVFLSVVISLAYCQYEGTLVFEDNFDGNSLDLDNWDVQEGCTGFAGGLQCYRRENIAVRNGIMTISVRPQTPAVNGRNYTSGRIHQRESFTYGTFVSRARLARGDHLWPAIWMLTTIGSGANQCRLEEIDIMEHRGQPSQIRRINHASHWGRSFSAFTSSQRLVTYPFDFSQDFHEFAVVWTPESIEWLVDGRKYFETSLTDGHFTNDPNKLPCEGEPIPFSEPNKFILNVAVGGSFFTRFPPMDTSTWTKPNMEVDYVRIYQ